MNISFSPSLLQIKSRFLKERNCHNREIIITLSVEYNNPQLNNAGYPLQKPKNKGK